MAYFSMIPYSLPAGNTQISFPVTFPYDPSRASLEARLDGVVQKGNWTYDSVSGMVVFDSPPVGGELLIRRITSLSSRDVIFSARSILSETEQNRNTEQLFDALQESYDMGIYLSDDSLGMMISLRQEVEGYLASAAHAASRAEAAAAACEDVADDTSIAWHNNAVDAHPAMMTAHRTARGAHPPEYLTGADYNTLTQSGDYYVSPGDGAPNAPDNFSYMVHVAAYEQTSWGRVFQTATRYVTGSAIRRTYTRVGTRATTGGEITWTAWEPLSYRDASGNILSDTYATRADPQLTGTVTFTTGNYATQLFVSSPQGSSRNRLYVDSDLYVDGFIKCLPAGSGSYIKLADGTVIQRGTMSVADSLLSLNVTFPYAFSMTPTVLLTDMHSESVHNHWIVSNVSETGFGAVMDRWDSEQGKADFCWVAIGQ